MELGNVKTDTRDNVSVIIEAGKCTRCGACGGCRHIHFEVCSLSYSAPAIDDGCERCGKCLEICPQK